MVQLKTTNGFIAHLISEKKYILEKFSYLIL